MTAENVLERTREQGLDGHGDHRSHVLSLIEQIIFDSRANLFLILIRVKD